jgi:hypothetical protein
LPEPTVIGLAGLDVITLPDLQHFFAARNHFDSLLRRLGADEAARMTHTDVEVLVEKEGREALRLAFQGHLDLRAARARDTRPASVVGTDGRERSHLRDSSRLVQVVFGPERLVRWMADGRDPKRSARS